MDEHKARRENVSAYMNKATKKLKKFARYDILQVPSSKNSNTDTLAHLAMSKDSELLKTILVEVLERPTNQEEKEKEVTPIEVMTGWMLPIYEFLTYGKLLEDRVEAKKLYNRSTRYIIYENILYHRGHSTPLLHSLNGKESGRVLKEIHDGIYGNQIGGHSLAYKVLRQRYY